MANTAPPTQPAGAAAGMNGKGMSHCKASAASTATYLAFLKLACIRIWLRAYESALEFAPALGARAVVEDFPLGERNQLAHGIDMEGEDFIARGRVMVGEPEREQFGQRRALDAGIMPG